MNSDNLKGVLSQFHDRPLPRAIPRALSLPVDSAKVVGLVGVRRSGKTFLFFQAMESLLQSGATRDQIVYLNFEDDRLQPIRAEELDLVLRSHRELFPEAKGKRIYLFLDEVQNVPDWERWVRRIHDTEEAQVFVTGSSSNLLGRDLATSLRGRSISLKVFPLSFREFLQFRKIEWRPSHPDSESEIRRALETYLHWGGFPEIVLAEEAMRPLILNEYSTLMLYRDVVERYGVRNESLMRELLRYAFRNTATFLNGSKLYRDLTSRGLSLSKNTLFDYLEHLTDSLLINLIPKRDRSLRKQAHNPKKLHVLDPGLVAAFDGRPDRDRGRKMETVIFQELNRRGLHLFYHSNHAEVDLCTEDGMEYWNIAWDISDPDTLDRERRAMEAGKDLARNSQGWLLYHEFAGEVLEKLPKKSVPAWRWLLQDGLEVT